MCLTKIQGTKVFFTDGKNTFKKCSRCDEIKPANLEFFQRGGGANFSAACKICLSVKNNPLPIMHINEKGHLYCRLCKKYLEENKFHLNKNFPYRNHRQPRCIDCAKVFDKKYEDKKSYYNVDKLIKHILAHTKQRMKRPKTIKRGIVFDITFEQIKKLYDKQEGLCALSGVPMTAILQGKHVATNISIDRIDSNIGYTLSNVQLVCLQVNYMKNTLSNFELKDWCLKIINTI